MTKARILADYVAGGTTATEFDYMDGVTSNVQTQLTALDTAKAPLASPTFTGTTTVSGDLVPSTPLTNRNMIINGAMQVSQRGNVTIPHSGTGVYTSKDRFSIYNGSSAAYTTKASETAYPIEEFPQCLQLDVTTSDTGLTAGDRSEIVYKAEGQDLQAWNKGKATAKPVTLSFWIRTSVTGTYILECYDADSTRHICKSYTVSSANTWEKKVITIDADTTGVWDNDNSESLSIRWWLIAGSTYNSGTLQTTWASAVSANRAVGQVNAVSSTSNFIYLTGVQLELGSNATPFEHRSYGDELARCQRYYEQLVDGYDSGLGVGLEYNSGTGLYVPVYFTTAKRVDTWAVKESGTNYYMRSRRNNNVGCVVTGFQARNKGGGVLTITASSDAGVDGGACWVEAAESDANVAIDAEL